MKPAYLVPAAAAGGAGSVAYLLLARPGVPPDIDAAIESSPELRYSAGGQPAAVRKDNARLIIREFTAAGYPLTLAVAAVVNAQAESGLSHTILSNVVEATGTREDSVGLFQLRTQGAGAGMSTAQRQDPVLNTRRIIQEVRQFWKTTGPGVESLEAAVARGATVAELAGLFAYHIERPRDRAGALAVRAARARSLFPSLADARSLTGGGVPAWRYALVAALAGIAAAGAWAARRRYGVR